MAIKKIKPRGIRNHNPGNIRISKDLWRGQLPLALSSKTDKEFCVFIEPHWGIRALIVLLRNYGNKMGIKNIGNDKIDTVYEVINRWAPTNENDTNSYALHVADYCGVGVNDVINLKDEVFLTKLVKAIILHENGQQPYTDGVIKKAFDLSR